MSEQQQTPSNDDLNDAVTDRLLAEALGGETPPDLRDAIHKRVEDAKVEVAGRGQEGPTRGGRPAARRVSGRALAWLAALVMITTGAVVALSPSSTDRLAKRDAGSRVETAPSEAPPAPASVSEVESALAEPADGLATPGATSPFPIPLDKPFRQGSFNTPVESAPSERAVPPGSRVEKSDEALWSRVPQTPAVIASPKAPAAAAPARENQLALGFGERYESLSARRQLGRAPARRSRGDVTLGGVPAFDDQYDFRHRSSGDRYESLGENPFVTARGGDAVSTFSIDVDTASYANVRQMLLDGSRLPPAGAVRIEELVNYFDYAYEPPAADAEAPFAATIDAYSCPWNPTNRLVRIGVKGREIAFDKRPLSNLVFLVDVSGSMNQPNKLPLLVDGLKRLTRQLGENDRVAIVVYASSEGLALESTSGAERGKILAALDRLSAGGSTAGGAGIRLAYDVAERNFIRGGVNRVLLCTDGDFNVGLTDSDALGDLVERKAKETGVFLSVLGFGRGNLNDAMMETVSGRGNGVYSYIDTDREAHRVLVRQMSGTLVTIAKDVKLQVEFNPARVASYRLIGYENRMLKTEDFNDDTKDAGEIGAGHTVTALYEVVPAGAEPPAAADPLKYQPAEAMPPGADPEPPTAFADELLTLKVRYKQPDADTSTKLAFPLVDGGDSFEAAGADFKFAAAAAQFGMLLRDSAHKGDATLDGVLALAEQGLGDDPHGDRSEFLGLVRKAKSLRGE